MLNNFYNHTCNVKETQIADYFESSYWRRGTLKLPYQIKAHITNVHKLHLANSESRVKRQEDKA